MINKNVLKTPIPAPFRIFIRRAVLLFICWQVAYLSFLRPAHLPDAALTELTANVAASILSSFGFSTDVRMQYARAVIDADGHSVVTVADACNGLDLYVLYVGFLVCFPYGSIKRRLMFALPGLPIILLINALRCAGLAWLNINHPQFTDFAHHYLFKVIVYTTIFFGWVWYAGFRTPAKQ